MQIRTFSVDPAIIYSLISAQAGTLAKALLECIMNSVDAGASEVTITFDQTTLRVTDNGRGFTKVEEIEKYFEVFGFPHENDALQSQRVYGQFGIGRAQLWTFASTVWRTAQFQMDVDIKNRGLEYERRDNCEPVPGVTIEGRFYEPLSARDVLVTEKELADLSRYVPVPVTVNGKRVSTEMDKVKWTHETEDAWTRIKETGDFAVYNLGVLVRRYPAYHFGCGGEVVTKPGVRLELNMARNDVLVAKCPVWKRIRPFVQQKSDQVIRKKRATTGEVEAAKQNQIQRALAGELESSHDYYDFCYNAKLITDVTGRHLSIHTAMGHISGAWVLAECRKEPRAVKLAEGNTALVLSPETLERFDVESVAELKAVLARVLSHPAASRYGCPAQLEKIGAFESLEEAGCSLSLDHRLVENKNRTREEVICLAELRSIQHQVSRLVSFRLHGNYREVGWRELYVGLSSTAEAWTDGRKYIAIERDQLKLARKGLSGFIKLAGLLVHEYLHDASSAGSHVHDEGFYSNFHDIMLSDEGANLGILAMRKYVSDCRRRDVKLTRMVVDTLDLSDMTPEYGEVPLTAESSDDEENLKAA